MKTQVYSKDSNPKWGLTNTDDVLICVLLFNTLFSFPRSLEAQAQADNAYLQAHGGEKTHREFLR